jgi:hypothetical protein
MNQEADQRRVEPAAELPDGGGPTVGACGRRCPCGQRSWRECPDQRGWLACQRSVSNQSLVLGVSFGLFLNIPLLIALDLILDPIPLVDWGDRVARAMGVSERVGGMSVSMAYFLFLPSMFSVIAYVWLKRRSLTAKKMEVKMDA